MAKQLILFCKKRIEVRVYFTMPTKTRKILILILTVFAVTGWCFAKSGSYQVIEVGRFSEMDLNDWKEKSFVGNTQYMLEKFQGRIVLHASADMSASALFKKLKINIQETPYLNWSWFIDSALPPLDEETKGGDDYAARIYVVVKTGIAPWKTYALNYVWSSNSAPSPSWPNAFTGNAIMIPIRTANDADNTWQMEKVNVRDDIKKYLGKEIKHIAGIAIMTDTDNSGEMVMARYGDIYFSAN